MLASDQSSEAASLVTAEVACRRLRDGRQAADSDVIAREIRLVIRGQGGRERILWAAPLDLAPLALGHAVLEWPEAGRPVLERWEGETCFLRFEPWPGKPVPEAPRLAPGDVTPLMRAFIREPGLWDGTGCFHRAGAVDPVEKRLLARTEDIGRHNCLDRLAGWALAESRDLAGLILFLSARVTASMLQKASAAGFSLIVSRSAVTTASVDMAQASGVTLIGFARENENRFTVFTDPGGRLMG